MIGWVIRFAVDFRDAFVAARDAAGEILNPVHPCGDDDCTDDHGEHR